MSLPVSHFSFRSTNSTAAPGPVSPNQSRKKKSSKNLTALWKWTVRRSAARKLILISATFSMTAPARRLALLHQLRHSSFHPSREIEGIRLWPIFAIGRRGRGSVRRRLDRSQLTVQLAASNKPSFCLTCHRSRITRPGGGRTKSLDIGSEFAELRQQADPANV